jgi:hypothetical protein
MRTSRGNIMPVALAASAILGVIASMSFLLVSNNSEQPLASLTLSPNTAVVTIDNDVQVDVSASASITVNAFGGVIHFDETVLDIKSIDYNTSIADLWAEAPWYEKGAGTISFGGGTTKPGGFQGTGSLMTITFRAKTPGSATITLRDIQILKHDGYGTALSVDTSIDSVLTVAEKHTDAGDDALVVVRSEIPTADLNNDGTVSIRDLSQLLQYLATADVRGDINGDSHVNLSDVSILMGEL